MIQCPKCGYENPDGAMNCKNCRINLEFAIANPEQVRNNEPIKAQKAEEVEELNQVPWWRKEGITNVTRITEIDLTKQARALACLRLADYALVVLCGFFAVKILPSFFFQMNHGLVANFLSNDTFTLVFNLITLIVFGFAAYTGWRHAGVIDPTVWRAHRVVFSSLLVFFLIMVMGVLFSENNLSIYDRAEVVMDKLVDGFMICCGALLGLISIMLLRRMKISTLGTTVDQLLLRLSKSAGTSAVQATHIKRINKPRGLAICAVGVLLLLASAMIYFIQPNQWRSWYVALLGFFVLIRGRRYFQINADSLLAIDQRAPILFLRSFDDDERQIYRLSDRAFVDFSLETRLTSHFSRFGPFIAIGSPKETVPQLGAARVLLSDDEWQPRVKHWIQDASLIIMYSGKTHWVNWELRKVLQNESITRLILMIPQVKGWLKSKLKKEISARVEHIRAIFKNTPWEEELLMFDDFVGLRAMLFRPDGSMVMIKSRSRRRDSYHLAALVAHQILLDSAALKDKGEGVRKATEIGSRDK